MLPHPGQMVPVRKGIQGRWPHGTLWGGGGQPDPTTGPSVLSPSNHRKLGPLACPCSRGWGGTRLTVNLLSRSTYTRRCCEVLV